MKIKSLRILAAIMFSDIVGYTSLMQEDEKNAKMLRDKFRKTLEDCVLQHTGNIQQYYGDGALTIFGSAIEAVQCAVEIQKKLLEEPAVPVRIGIHAGDIVYEDDGVYGDGVNIASRLETMSSAGAVLISEKVFDELKNHDDLPAVSLGRFELKNVKKPIEIFALSVEGLTIPNGEVIHQITGIPQSYNSIAVLPFINMSPDADNEYFSDGITEEIINSLTKVNGLKVTSRTSSFAFKGKNEDIRKIGAQLNVNTVLEGSVRKSGNKVRITAQLINTSDGYHQWSEVYDRELEDIFEIQDEISQAITNKLADNLVLEKVGQSVRKARTKNIDAYNLYLKGTYYWKKWTPENFKKAIGFYEESIKIDPEFALPYSGLANSYIVLGATGQYISREAYPKAKEYALRALELDRYLTESHVSLGLVKLFYYWDWNGAYESFSRAQELNPGSADVHHALTLYYVSQGNLENALKEIHQAYLLDPLSMIINSVLGEIYYMAEKYDEAIEQLNKTVDLDPGFRSAIWNLGFAYLAQGNYNKALEVFRRIQKQTDDSFKCLGPLGYAFAKCGLKKETEEILEMLKIKEEKEKTISLSLDFALVFAGLNDEENFYKYLNKAYEERSGGLVFLKCNPIWNGYRTHPRFVEILRKMNL